VTCRPAAAVVNRDDAASYLGIATPNQRRISVTVQSIASMLANFDVGKAKLGLVRMPRV
jgi:hypothetical protein